MNEAQSTKVEISEKIRETLCDLAIMELYSGDEAGGPGFEFAQILLNRRLLRNFHLQSRYL